MTVTGSSRSRISRIRSSPLIPGKRRSVNTNEHGCSTNHSSADVPSVAIVICRSGWAKQLRELLADQLAVVHHEDASIHGALIRVEVGGPIPG